MRSMMVELIGGPMCGGRIDVLMPATGRARFIADGVWPYDIEVGLDGRARGFHVDREASEYVLDAD